MLWEMAGYDGGKGGSHTTHGARALTGLLGNGKGGGGRMGNGHERARWKPDPGRRPVRCALRPCLGDLVSTSPLRKLRTPSHAFTRIRRCSRSLLEHGLRLGLLLSSPLSVNRSLCRPLELPSRLSLLFPLSIWPGKGYNELAGGEMMTQHVTVTTRSGKCCSGHA